MPLELLRSTMLPSAFYVYSILLFSSFLNLTAGLMRGNETDRAALLEFKSHVSNDPFGALSSWNETVHFCKWYGVTCSSRHQRVTVLNLQSSKLVASISPHIGNLSFLMELHLADNKFSLGIPPEIGQLHRLRVLNVQNNSLGGMLPRDLFNCSNLIDIYMNRNQLEGSIPSEIGLLSKLQSFYISNNNLSGPIPHSVGNLSSLRTLSAAVNGLQGIIPDALVQLKNIQRIGLGANNISGTIPPTVFNKSNMIVLDFTANNLHGVLPSDMFSALPNLEYFGVGANLFSGSIPASLSNASNLEMLEFAYNQLSGTVPCLANLKRLQIISLSANLLGSGRVDDLNFLSSLVNASRLRRAGIAVNRFGGVLPESISNLSSTLTILRLGYNGISGNIPSGIENLFNLAVLDVRSTLISGTIPPGVGKLQKLVILYLNNNKLSGSIPSSTGNLTLLTKFLLGDNMLQGNIPSIIGNLQNLLVLDLSRNNFTGLIPAMIFRISSLTQGLYLSRNNLMGPLPDTMDYDLKNLGALDISENMLSGTIPSTLGSCIRLEILSLAGNNFHGSIPSSLSSLRGLGGLDLSRNNLSGKIPSFLESLNLLQTLNLSYNMFEGAVPVDGVFKNASAVALMGNDKLCGGSAELHLPECILNEPGNQKSNLTRKLAISIPSSLLVLTLLALLILFCLFKRKTRGPSSSSPTYGSLLLVTYYSLLRATDGFSEANLIGLGAFGSVYKGIMCEGENSVVIAVKVLNLLKRGAIKSFVAECEALRNIRHRNLVKVLTACSGIDNSGHDFKALVYEFMPNGSLEDWLHWTDPQGGGEDEEELQTRKELTLAQRLDIAIDTASALDYLHSQCDAPIIHCDLKPSNILLDSEMVAHIGDFGLAKFVLGLSDQLYTSQSSSIGIRGSTGYVAPEYGMGSEVSALGDVYSYGIILLEMFTRKRPTDDMFDERMNLQDYAERALAGGVEEVADPAILVDLRETRDSATRYNAQFSTSDWSCRVEECLVSVFRIGLACSKKQPKERMVIGKVVAELNSIKKKLFESADSLSVVH